MSGHSKWATTKHKKAVIDARRAKSWAKLIKNIEVAAKLGGPDLAGNPTLYDAVLKAKKTSVPKDNIDRAIKKAMGGDTEAYENVRYEGYAPGGVAVIAEALTDNRNRTGGVVRSVFTKYGGNLGATGSVSHMFSHAGEITYKPEAGSPDAILEAAIEAGAEDVVSDENGHLITCPFDTLGTVAGALEAALGEAESVKSVWKPNLTTPVDEDAAQSIMKMIAALEDDDDVQNVYANFEISEEVLKKLTAA
jgi:YebC/PmpR family DNA-binding regulatory protein